jgi:hypothetical protein
MDTVSPKAVPVEAPIALLEQALGDLDTAISFSSDEVTLSHTVVFVHGLDNPKVPTSIGRYLVGALAGAVDIDARLCELLLARGADRRSEITSTVISIIGQTNSFDTPAEEQFRDTRRNAWIGEGVGHALLMVAARRDASFIKGQVCALSEVHQNPTRQGLDSVSIYVTGGALVVAIGESKATRAYASKELGGAAEIFTDVDEGVYGPDLRARLAAFRRILPDGLAVQVSDSLWSNSSCYLPMIVHQDAFNAMANRATLARLKPPIDRRRVIVMQLDKFHAFFNAIADSMRAAIAEVVA